MIDQAIKDGWDHRAACRVIELPESRAWRWRRRRDADRLDDRPSGGKPLHGLLPDEAVIVALFEEWDNEARRQRRAGRVIGHDQATNALPRI
jgi:hypothetical protein